MCQVEEEHIIRQKRGETGDSHFPQKHHCCATYLIFLTDLLIKWELIHFVLRFMCFFGVDTTYASCRPIMWILMLVVGKVCFACYANNNEWGIVCPYMRQYTTQKRFFFLHTMLCTHTVHIHRKTISCIIMRVWVVWEWKTPFLPHFWEVNRYVVAVVHSLIFEFDIPPIKCYMVRVVHTHTHAEKRNKNIKDANTFLVVNFWSLAKIYYQILYVWFT